MIRVKELTKIFNPGTAHELKAVSGLSFEIHKGSSVVIAGANGSGKSTLLNLIAGSVFPNDGNIYFNGNDVTNLPEFKRSKYISRVFQDPFRGTASELSILDNFRLASIRSKPKKFTVWQDKNFKSFVQDKIKILGLGLENKINTPAGVLSGGQRQAITLLLAVMDTSSVLLMDEPVSALDPRMSEFIMAKAKELIKENNLTAILVSHRLADIKNFGDRLIVLSEGKIMNDMNSMERTSMPEENFLQYF